MSSKEQFRDALKRDKQLIVNIRKEIEAKDEHIKILRAENFRLERKLIELKQAKKWWQFWK